MQPRTRLEHLPQAFNPNSRTEKKVNLDKAREVLHLAQRQGRKVIFVKQGDCAFSRQRDPKPKKEIAIIDGKMYTTKEAAKTLGLSINCLQQHKKNGKIAAEKIRGKLFYSSEEVERFKNRKNKN